MNQDLKFRLGGLVCLIAAGGFGWWGIWQPYQAALTHAPEVKYSLKIFLLVPALLVFGLFFLIGGTRWQYRDAQTKRFSMVGWVLMAVTVVLSGLGFWWLQHVFAGLGYTQG